MANRTFGPQTLTGSAQPLMSDVTTAAVVAAPKGVAALITVANTAIYQNDDRIVLEPGTANQDAYKVYNILSSTVLQCVPEAVPIAHANGSLIALSRNAMDVVVQPKSGGTATVYIGSDKTVTSSGGGNTIAEIGKTTAGTPTIPWHMAGGTDHDLVNSGDAWMAGADGDVVFVYASVI